MRKTITNEIRNMIIQDSRHGDYRSEVARRYGVSINTVCKIVKNDPQCDWYHRGGLTCGRGNYNLGR